MCEHAPGRRSAFTTAIHSALEGPRQEHYSEDFEAPDEVRTEEPAYTDDFEDAAAAPAAAPDNDDIQARWQES